MPHTVVEGPGVVTSVDDGDEVKVAIVSSPVVIDVDDPTPIHVSTPKIGLQGPQGPPGTSGALFQTVHTFALQGDIKVDGGNDFIPPFYVMVAPGQTVKLAKARHRINSGFNVQCKLQRNGVDIPGFSPISVSTATGTTNPPDITLADGDSLALVIVETLGLPRDLSFTLVLEHEA